MREQWYITNISTLVISIGDLPKLPSLNPNQTLDLLLYYQKDQVSLSSALLYLLNTEFISLNKHIDGINNIITSNFEEAISTVEQDNIPSNPIDYNQVVTIANTQAITQIDTQKDQENGIVGLDENKDFSTDVTTNIQTIADTRSIVQIQAQKNIANGIFGLNENGEAVGPVVASADTAANLSLYTPDAGEIVYETDTDMFKVGNGLTACPGLKSIPRSVLLENLNLNGYSLTSGTGQHIYITPGSGAGVGIGSGAVARLPSMMTHSCGIIGQPGDLLVERFILHGWTNDATPTELIYPNRYTLSVNHLHYALTVTVTGYSYMANDFAMYKRMCLLKYFDGTVSLSGAVQTIGTDIETDASWNISLTADNTNKSLNVTVTGEADMNILWAAAIEAIVVGDGND